MGDLEEKILVAKGTWGCYAGRMFNQKLLERCSQVAAPSGFEGPVRRLVREELASCATVVTHTSGNIVCSLPGSGPRVGLLAHLDEIGFMVQGVTPDGFLLVAPLGGWWNHTLPSQRMRVLTRDGRSITGQVGTKPPHLLPESQRKQVMATESLFVDVGASDAAEVEALGIRPGCAVAPDVALQPLAVPHRWMGKAFDNRAGVYAMIRSLQTLGREHLDCSLKGIGTVQEEVGTRGARALEEPLDLAIILEGPPADDTLGQSAICRQGALGQGVQVRLYDPTNITPPALADWVLEVAAEENIPCQPAVRRTGGTDAAASYPNWQGRPAIVLGVPVRYIHAHNGILDDRDLESCVALVCALVRRLNERSIRPFLQPGMLD